MTGSKSPSDPRRAEGVRRLGRVRIAGVVAAIVAAVLLAIVGQGSGRAVFDRYQRMWPWAPAQSAVALVLIDSDSIRELGPWPWPRYLLARLSEEIASRGAVAIGFDTVFAEEDRFRPDAIITYYSELSSAAKTELAAIDSMDLLFARVVGQHPVVLGRVGVDETSVDFATALARASTGLPVEAAFSQPLPDGVLHFSRALTNIPDLDEVASGLALINGQPDPDGVVRSVPLVARITHAGESDHVDNVAVPGLALELARVGQGLDKIEPVVRGGKLEAVTLGKATLPVTPEGAMRLHFARVEPASLTSAHLLFKNDERGQRFAPDRFNGKIVLVGLTAAGTTDVVATPTRQTGWGVYVQALAIDAILQGHALDRPGWAVSLEWAVGALLAAIAVLLFPRLGAVAGVLVPAALLVVVVGGTMLAFARFGLLIDPLRPLGVGAAAAAAVLVGLFVEGGAAQRRLRHALEEERVGAARAQGELEAARDIQLGMLPPHDMLRSLEPRFDLDAAIEPARSVGGDFYDAVKLPDGRLCFLVADVTGKGVPAALFMALSKALSKSVLLREGGDLAVAVDQLNTEIARDNSEDMFVTMLVGIADPATGAVELCNAGHENPLVVRGDGSIESLALDGGPPLCVAEGFPYTVEQVVLAPGEALVVVTDGVTEAQSSEGGFFGHERMVAALAGWTGSAGEAADRLVAAVRGFEAGGEPSDDVTILAIRYRG